MGLLHKEYSHLVPRVWAGGALVRDPSAPGQVGRDRSGKKRVDYALELSRILETAQPGALAGQRRVMDQDDAGDILRA